MPLSINVHFYYNTNILYTLNTLSISAQIPALMSESGDRERIITINIAGHTYRVKIRENKIKDRPYITIALHLNLNKSQDLEIARFLEQLTQEFKPRSGNELLKQIILSYKELRTALSGLELSKIEDITRRLYECEEKLATFERKVERLKSENEKLRNERSRLLELKRENKKLKRKISRLQFWLEDETREFNIRTGRFKSQIKVKVTGPRIILDALRKAEEILSETDLTKLLQELEKIRLITIAKQQET